MPDSTKSKLENMVHQRTLSQQDRETFTRSIYRHMLANSDCIKHGNFVNLSQADLGLLFQLTDETFFEGQVGKLCEQVAECPLAFRLSTRMTTSGGMTTMFRSRNREKTGAEFEIAIATTPLFSTFRDGSEALVSGVPCTNRLQALQRIMEHEMVHLIEMLLWNDSNCSAKPFKQIVRRFFGHTASNHQLLTPRDIARKQLGVQQGDQVTFLFEGRHLRGHINRITKRATVLVQDANGIRYTDGNSYQKFYVPINRLKRA